MASASMGESAERRYVRGTRWLRMLPSENRGDIPLACCSLQTDMEADEMDYPSPDDLKKAPAWENYVVGQAVQASLGLIPRSALAVGVDVDGSRVSLVFQLSCITESDEADIADIVDDLSTLVGEDVQVSQRSEVRDTRQIAARDRTWWIYLAHDDETIT